MSWNYVWIIEFGNSRYAVLFASIRGGIWDEYCEEEGLGVEHLVQIYWNDEDVSIAITCFFTGLLDNHVGGYWKNVNIGSESCSYINMLHNSSYIWIYHYSGCRTW